MSTEMMPDTMTTLDMFFATVAVMNGSPADMTAEDISYHANCASLLASVEGLDDLEPQQRRDVVGIYQIGLTSRDRALHEWLYDRATHIASGALSLHEAGVGDPVVAHAIRRLAVALEETLLGQVTR